MAYEDVCSSRDLIYVKPEARFRDNPHDYDVICGCLTHVQAGIVVGGLSIIYAVLMIVHESALEDGQLDAKNFVAIGISLSWVVTSLLLFLALMKRASFLLTPWLIMTSLLTLLFLIAVVVGCRYIAICVTRDTASACAQEYSLFGTHTLTTAILDLALLVIILFSNMIGLLVVYRICVFLPVSNNSRKNSVVSPDKDPPSTFRQRMSKNYLRSSRRSDPEVHEPLFGSDSSSHGKASRLS